MGELTRDGSPDVPVVDGRDSAVASALAEAARVLDNQRTSGETLNAVVELAVTAVPGFDRAGIVLSSRKHGVQTVAATDTLVEELAALEYDVGEGPCLNALAQGPVVTVEHAHHEQRWPKYLPSAARLGLRSQLALRLFTDRGSVAGLTFYSTEVDEIDPQAPGIAELFAVHAAVALGHSRQVEGLQEALSSRKVIGQAIGILMERFRLDEERAFQFLLRSSQQTNVKLRDVAAGLIAGTPTRREG